MCRELERKEDERIAKEQELIRQREENEMRRERGQPASPRANTSASTQGDSLIVGKKSLFRAPSPVIDFNQHQYNDMEVGQPIQLNGGKEEAKKRLFSPPTSQQLKPTDRAVSPPLPAAKPNRRNLSIQGIIEMFYSLHLFLNDLPFYNW